MRACEICPASDAKLENDLAADTFGGLWLPKARRSMPPTVRQPPHAGDKPGRWRSLQSDW